MQRLATECLSPLQNIKQPLFCFVSFTSCYYLNYVISKVIVVLNKVQFKHFKDGFKDSTFSRSSKVLQWEKRLA